MEVAYVVGEHAVLVRQEAKTPLLLQQRLPAAIGDELLHVHLPRRDGGHILQEDSKVAQLWEKIEFRENSNQTQSQRFCFLLKGSSR